MEQSTNSEEKINEKNVEIIEDIEEKNTVEESEETNGSQESSKENIEANEKEIDDLMKKIEILEKEKNDIKDKYIRMLAETENFKKRQTEQIKDLKKFALENIVVEILPILDNFNRAFFNVESIDNIEKAKNVIDGLKAIEKQLEDTLRKNGVEGYKSLNEKFDPNMHQAIQCETVEEDDLHDVVIEEYQKGYKLNGRIVRTAMVKVGKKG